MKKDIIIGFFLGVLTTTFLLFFVGNIEIETDIQIGEKTEQEDN